VVEVVHPLGLRDGRMTYPWVKEMVKARVVKVVKEGILRSMIGIDDLLILYCCCCYCCYGCDSCSWKDGIAAVDQRFHICGIPRLGGRKEEELFLQRALLHYLMSYIRHILQHCRAWYINSFDWVMSSFGKCYFFTGHRILSRGLVHSRDPS